MGYVERQNLLIEYRWADYQQERLAGLASDLVQRRVAAIVTMGGPAGKDSGHAERGSRASDSQPFLPLPRRVLGAHP